MARYDITPELTPEEARSTRAWLQAISRTPKTRCPGCGAEVCVLSQTDLTYGRRCQVCREADWMREAIARLRRDARAREWNGDHDEEAGER